MQDDFTADLCQADETDLETVLAAWHGATVRLEQTHAALREEVRRLTDELEIKNRELARKNRLADLGQIASHIAHEVRNNLVPVSLYLSLLRRRICEDSGSCEVLDKVEAGVMGLDTTVNDLLHFTAERDPHWIRVPLRQLIDDVRSSLAPQLAAQGIEVEMNIPGQLEALADREMLRRAVLNIALNAIDAMPDGGQLVFTAYAGTDVVELEIADTGPGLSDEVSRRAFEPFFTTKSTGTGLGLAIVDRVAEVHGGEVLATNCPEGGAAFTIRIPQESGGCRMSTKSRATCATITSVSAQGRVLVVDDHRQARESMVDILRHAGHHVESLSSAVEALQYLAEHGVDVVLTDLQMPGMSGLEFIRELERRQHGAQVVMVTAYASVSSAVEAMRHGAFDYIEKPFAADRLEQLVERAVAHGRLLDDNRPLPAAERAGISPVMIGSGLAMQALRSRMTRAAPTGETMLITGESGTGKELVAQAVHAASTRAGAPLIGLNCPALSAHLLESELFGHERGAFTGADASRTGRFELADGGTILLDEVTEIDLALQAKLLRVLQEKSFERVGSSETRQVDVRVLATTNRNLRLEVAAGRFREDLFYRLAVIPLEVPPLRERREDIPELVDYFLTCSAARLHREPATLEPGAHDLLLGYRWPGNVRELQNIITRASVLGGDGPISADELRPWLIAAPGTEANATLEDSPVGLSLHDMERKLIESTLEHFEGHRAKTAEALGIGLRTLSGKLKEYGYAPRARKLAKAG